MTTQTSETSSLVAIDMGEKLGIPSLKKKQIELPADFLNDSFVGNPDPSYVLREDTVKEIAAFLKFPLGDAMYVVGPTGSGKTSVLIEVANRIAWPHQSVTCHGRLELTDLVGFTVPVVKDGAASMEFQYGPLATAMKHGHILILNEIDLVDPSELAGLNDILEGRPLVIAQNGGEVIKPHPFFRVIVTGNSNGSGDATGMYGGIQQQNLAAMDRYRMIMIDYAEEAVELEILSKKAPALAPLHKGMVDVANLVRGAFVGDETNPDADRLSVTMSTRTLIRWANMTQIAAQSPNALEKGLSSALLLRGSPEDREVILRFAGDIFGDNWVSSKKAA